MAIFRGDKNIVFISDNDKHEYRFLSKPDVIPLSVTRVISKFKEPFDEQRVSYYVARKRLRGEHWCKGMEDVPEEDIRSEQVKVLKEWSEKARVAREHGSYIHNTCEDGFNGLPVPSNMSEVFHAIWERFSRYAAVVPEPVIGLSSRNVTGKPDYLNYRRRSSNVIDLKDIKTNLASGIQMDSTLVRDGRVRHYDRFMKGPVSHLEDCNYNHYALQLSMYAYILEKEYGFRIGSLEIIHIHIESEDLKNNQILPIFEITTYPVNYLRSEVAAMIEEVYEQESGGF